MTTAGAPPRVAAAPGARREPLLRRLRVVDAETDAPIVGCRIANVPPERRSVTTDDVVATTTADGVARVDPRAADLVALADGYAGKDIGAADEVRLSPTAVVRVVCRDADGRPLPGAQVYLCASVLPHAWGDLTSTAAARDGEDRAPRGWGVPSRGGIWFGASDAKGEVEFAMLERGSYHISARADGHICNAPPDATTVSLCGERLVVRQLTFAQLVGFAVEAVGCEILSYTYRGLGSILRDAAPDAAQLVAQSLSRNHESRTAIAEFWPAGEHALGAGATTDLWLLIAGRGWSRREITIQTWSEHTPTIVVNEPTEPPAAGRVVCIRGEVSAPLQLQLATPASVESREALALAHSGEDLWLPFGSYAVSDLWLNPVAPGRFVVGEDTAELRFEYAPRHAIDVSVGTPDGGKPAWAMLEARVDDENGRLLVRRPVYLGRRVILVEPDVTRCWIGARIWGGMMATATVVPGAAAIQVRLVTPWGRENP